MLTGVEVCITCDKGYWKSERDELCHNNENSVTHGIDNQIGDCLYHDALNNNICWRCKEQYVLNYNEVVCIEANIEKIKNCRKFNLGSVDTCKECNIGYYQVRNDNKYCAPKREVRDQVSQIAIQVKKKGFVKAFILKAQDIYPTERELKFYADFYYSDAKTIYQVNYRFRVTNGLGTEIKCDVGDAAFKIDAMCTLNGNELALNRNLLRRGSGYRLTVQVVSLLANYGDTEFITRFERNDIYIHVFDVVEYTSYGEMEELDFWPKNLDVLAKKLPFADVNFIPDISTTVISTTPNYIMKIYTQTFEEGDDTFEVENINYVEISQTILKIYMKQHMSLQQPYTLRITLQAQIEGSNITPVVSKIYRHDEPLAQLPYFVVKNKYTG